MSQKQNSSGARNADIDGEIMIDQLKNHENARAFSGSSKIINFRETGNPLDFQVHRKSLIFSCKKHIKIIVKPNSPKNEIKSYDKEKDAYRVNIKAPPEKGKANIEIIKYFSKLSKKKVKIISGLKSKEKILNVSS